MRHFYPFLRSLEKDRHLKPELKALQSCVSIALGLSGPFLPHVGWQRSLSLVLGLEQVG